MSCDFSCEVPEWIYKGPQQVGIGLIHTGLCFASLLPRIGYTVLSILSFGERTIAQKASFQSFRNRFECNNYFSSLYNGAFILLNPRSDFSFNHLQVSSTDSYLSAKARRILDFAGELAKAEEVSMYDSPQREETSCEKIENFFKSHLFSRILYAAGVPLVIIAKTIELAAGIIIGSVGLILAIPANLSKEWSQSSLLKHIHDTSCFLFMAVGMIDDLCMGLRAIINPHQEGLNHLRTLDI